MLVSETKEQEKPETLEELELLIYTVKLHKAPLKTAHAAEEEGERQGKRRCLNPHLGC